MARTLNRLTATGVQNAKRKGRYADGGGLYLRVYSATSKSWVFRWVRGGVENEMGLGPYPDVSLAEARASAYEARRHVAANRNPKTERDRSREIARTFGDAADEYLIAKDGNWTNEKTRWQWKHTLTEVAEPIRRVPIAEIDTQHILRQRLSRGHHPAMPYAEVPAFFQRLQGSDAMAARAPSAIERKS